MELTQVLKYYRNNSKKFAAIVIGIALSVLLVYSFQMIISSIDTAVGQTSITPHKYYSIIRQKDMNPDSELMEQIKAQPSVESILASVYWTTSIQMVVGGASSTEILQVSKNDMNKLIANLGLRIVKGRKPIAGAHELLMNQRVARNKHLNIGDSIGSYASKDEFIRGSYKIVGLVEGEAMVSFAPMETAMRDYYMANPYTFGGVVIPKDGKLDEMNAYLDKLPNSYQTITLASVKRSMSALESSVGFLTTGVSMMIMLIAATFTGLLCYIYFYQRRNEFGLLSALGFTRQQVINRSFVEITGMCIIGFVVGVLLSLLFGWILDLTVFKPKGLALEIFTAKSLVKACVVPVFATLFSVIPVWRMLVGLDPIMIVEGVE